MARSGYEDLANQINDLKGAVAKLKTDVAELKQQSMLAALARIEQKLDAVLDGAGGAGGDELRAMTGRVKAAREKVGAAGDDLQTAADETQT